MELLTQVGQNGVASQITHVEKCALYVHCYGYALDLVVRQTVKQSKICCKALIKVFTTAHLDYHYKVARIFICSYIRSYVTTYVICSSYNIAIMNFST